MWTKFKGQVLRGKDEKDLNDEDTIVTRALSKYYDPEIPAWLLPQESALRERVMAMHSGESRVSVENVQTERPVAHQAFASQQPYVRRESVPRLFDRNEPTSSAPVSAQASPAPSRSNTPGSGLASRLKSTRW